MAGEQGEATEAEGAKRPVKDIELDMDRMLEADCKWLAFGKDDKGKVFIKFMGAKDKPWDMDELTGFVHRISDPKGTIAAINKLVNERPET